MVEAMGLENVALRTPLMGDFPAEFYANLPNGSKVINGNT
jgi:hypothetical protein